MMMGFVVVTGAWLLLVIIFFFENTHKKAVSHLSDRSSKLQEESFEEPEAEIPISMTE